MKTKRIITHSQAKYTVTEDGAVTRERGDKDIRWTTNDFQYTEGRLLTPFDILTEGLSFGWYGLHEVSEGEGHAEVLMTSYIESITMEDVDV